MGVDKICKEHQSNEDRVQTILKVWTKEKKGFL